MVRWDRWAMKWMIEARTQQKKSGYVVMGRVRVIQRVGASMKIIVRVGDDCSRTIADALVT